VHKTEKRDDPRTLSFLLQLLQRQQRLAPNSIATRLAQPLQQTTGANLQIRLLSYLRGLSQANASVGSLDRFQNSQDLSLIARTQQLMNTDSLGINASLIGLSMRIAAPPLMRMITGDSFAAALGNSLARTVAGGGSFLKRIAQKVNCSACKKIGRANKTCVQEFFKKCCLANIEIKTCRAHGKKEVTVQEEV
jgi:hypothetical protein